jgi:hypothetical protein
MVNVRGGGALRTLPPWVWVLGALLFPAGVFLALAAARVLAWRAGVALAVVGHAALVAAVLLLMPYLNATGPTTSTLAALVLFLLLAGTGFWQYRIGRARGYWSTQAVRIWKIIGVVVIALMIIDVLAMGVRALLLSSLQSPPRT